MKYTYKTTYRIKSFNIELFIWNKERIKTIIQILTKISTYKPLFNYSEYRNIQENKYLYEIDNHEFKKCIFCLKDSNQTSFEKIPHVIPYLLGNNYLLHYEECDEYFGKTLECELDKYLNPHRTFNRLTNRRGNLIKTELGKNRSFRFDQDKNIYTGELLEDELLFAENSNHITINLKQHQYSPMLVYKALMKIFYGLLPREHLSKFEKIRKWIINKDNNFVLISPLSIVKTRLDEFSTSILDIVILYKETTTLDKFEIELPIKEDFEFLAYLRFGYIVFEFPIFTDLFFEKIQILQKNNLDISFSLPYIPKPKFPTNGEMLNFSESKKIVNYEPLYFSFDKIIKEKLK